MLHDATAGAALDVSWIELRHTPPLPRSSAQQEQPFLLHDHGFQLDKSQQYVPLSTLHAAREQLLMAAVPVIALGLCNVWPSSTLIPDGIADAQEEQRRLWNCIRSDAWPVFERKPMGTVDAPRQTALRFNEMTGVATVELDGSALVSALEAALRLVVRLGPAVHAVAFHISGVSWPSARLSARTLEQIYQVLDTVHGLGIPIACSVDDNVCRAGSAAWSAADYRMVGQHLHAVCC